MNKRQKKKMYNVNTFTYLRKGVTDAFEFLIKKIDRRKEHLRIING